MNNSEGAGDSIAEDMAGASKPANEECAPPTSSSSSMSSDGIISLIYSIAKKMCVVGVVYLAGYMNISIAWFLGPLVLSALRDKWRQESDLRRNIAKASAMASDKDIVLARVDELPAWVFFPDMERAEWLNRILVQVWPNVNHYTRTIIKDSIEPNVCASLANYKLNGFKFERMILGTIPPRIGGVKVYDKNLSRNEIIMDVDLFYAGDCDISFSLGGIKGGIKDFQIHGLLRIVMKPLIKTVPLVGGLQIFFLNNPTLDFNLVGVADILDMPGFSDVLRRCIIEQVAAMMVLPNKLPIKLSDDVASHDLKMPEPEGVLRIHVVEAKNLMKKDIGMLGKGKSDPYAVITVGAQEFRTQTIDNTVNPKWDYWCEAQISSRKRQCVGLTLWDWDPGFPGVQNDDFLGRCTVEISSIAKKGQIDTWLTLEQAKHGMIHLRLTWYKLSANVSDLKLAIEETQLLRVSGMSTALLTMYIDSCKNLPNARSQSKPDPYLVINVGKKTENTAVQMRTGDPVYEIGYTFLVGNPENDTIHIKAMDQKTGNQLGMLDFNLTGLLDKPGLQLEKQPFQLQFAGHDTKLVMAMSLKVLKHALPDPNGSDEEAMNPDPPAGDNQGTPVLGRGASVKSVSPSINTILTREASVKSNSDKSSDSPDSLRKTSDKVDDQKLDSVEEQLFSATAVSGNLSAPPDSPKLVRRTLSTTSSAGEAGLGRIQLSLRYSVQRQRLIVVIHKIMNIPLKDPTNIPDPYVKLHLLPGRSKESKRKTAIMKDNCNPIYDEQFEYIMSQGELNSQQLEVSVASQKGFFAGGSPIIGQVIVNLGDCDLSQPQCWWLDLLPESKD